MKQKTYLRWGVTITAAACAILVFYDTFFQDGVLFIFIEKLFGILKPVLYGLAMAYLLTPIVDFFDRLLRDRLGVKRAGLMRCLSILVTWLLALGLVYLLFSILIPELVASVSLLFSNLESYYRTIYTWVTQLVEDNPYISERVLTLVRDYYNELVDWVKNTVIPGAQVAIVAVTGGVLSVLVFAKDLLVGIVVSVYILARKETFGLHTRKLLYSLVSAPHYERALRATREADRIFSGFVRGKLLDSLIIGILCFIVCSILKFPYTPIIAVFVGVTNIIPIFGLLPRRDSQRVFDPARQPPPVPLLYHFHHCPPAVRRQHPRPQNFGRDRRHFELLDRRRHPCRRRLRRRAGYVPRRAGVRLHPFRRELPV